MAGDRKHGGDKSWVCWEQGCHLIGVDQYVVPPMTPREAFERHQRTNHPDPGPGRRP